MLAIWMFTGDGILAFAGGAMALIGVGWSNRQSVQNLQKQFDEDKATRADMRLREAKSVAFAVTFEMD